MKTAKLFFALHFLIYAAPSLQATIIPEIRDNIAYFEEIIDSEKINSYVDKFKHIAIAEMDRTNIPASIKMAQGILESGIGASELATKANNHFGIKCGGNWQGKSHRVWDDEPTKSCFRVYESAEESYIAHSEFLRDPKKESRYGFLFKLNKTDYKAWAKGLQSSGYATSKTYASKLIDLIERYELFKLDHLTLRTAAISQQEADEIFKWQKQVTGDNTIPRPIVDSSDPFKNPTAGSNESKPTPTPNEPTSPNKTASIAVWKNLLKANNHADKLNAIVTVNGLNAVIAKENESLAALAKRTNKRSRKLSRYNELKYRTITPYQYIFLARKQKKFTGNATRHTVKTNETLYDIAQFYGIRYRRLQRMNLKYKRGNIPVGVQIRLK